MNASRFESYQTFERYQAECKLQDQARELLYAVEAKADAGVRKAERLIEPSWQRYNRRSGRVNIAADRHWGAL